MAETIQFKYPDRTRLAELAHRRGYASIEAYLNTLIAADEDDHMFDVAAGGDARRDGGVRLPGEQHMGFERYPLMKIY